MLYHVDQLGVGTRCLLGCASGVLLSSIAGAGTVVYEKGDTSIEVGGRIQVQYLVVDPDTPNVSTTDDLFLRRLYLETEATLTENWNGKWQIDFAGDDVEIKDAYLEYTGFNIGAITIGNQYVPFSREKLTSSKYQQTVERQVFGDPDFGVPDRQLGLSLQGGERLQYWLGYYKAGIVPSTSVIEFDTRLNPDTEYFGDLVAGRIDFFPIGEPFELAQGDFERTGPRLGVAVNTFHWSNDDDDLADPSTDYDTVTGVGADAQFKFVGFDISGAYQHFTSETKSPTVTEGLVVSGQGDFDTYGAKGGYMIPIGSQFIEPVLGYQVLDPEAVPGTDHRILAGVNYFFNEHNDKVQFTYEKGSDVFFTDNASDNEANETAVGDDQARFFLQFQHLF